MRSLIHNILRIVVLSDLLQTLGCPVHSSFRLTCGCSVKSEFSLDSTSGRRTAYSVTLLTCTRVSNAIIPRFTSEGEQLDQIQFHDNAIEEVQNNAFIRLSRKNVQRISFTNDRISAVGRDAFSGITDSLRHLSFRNNSLTSLPVFSGLTLDTLNIEHNHIQTVISGWIRRTSITKLILENNEIKFLQAGAFHGLSDTLLELSLAGNLLNKITPEMFGDLRHLLKLDLDGNRIRHIEDYSFRGCQQLEELRISDNVLRVVTPRAFAGLETTLVSLDLGNNQLVRVEPYVFSNLHNLQRLLLAKNRLRRVLTGAFQNCSSLRDLRLERNNITHIADGAFAGLEYTLGHLYLQFNQLQTVPSNIFASLRRLGELWLHKNLIHRIEEGAFVTCRQLMILSLSGNAVNSLTQQTLRGLESSLQRLYLDHNKLTLPRYEMFASLRHLRVLYLGGNPLTCSCSLNWLTNPREMYIMSDLMHMSCKTARKKREYELTRFIRRFCQETTPVVPQFSTTEATVSETVSCATSSSTDSSLDQRVTYSNTKTALDHTTRFVPIQTTQNKRDRTAEFRTVANLFTSDEVTKVTDVSFVTANRNIGERNTHLVSSGAEPTHTTSPTILEKKNQVITTRGYITELSRFTTSEENSEVDHTAHSLNMAKSTHTTPQTSTTDSPFPRQTTAEYVSISDDRETPTVLPSAADGSESITPLSPFTEANSTVPSWSVTLSKIMTENNFKGTHVYFDVRAQTSQQPRAQPTETTAALDNTQEWMTDAVRMLGSTNEPTTAESRGLTPEPPHLSDAIKSSTTNYLFIDAENANTDKPDTGRLSSEIPENSTPLASYNTTVDSLRQKSRRPRPGSRRRGNGKGRGNRRGGRRGRKRLRTTSVLPEVYSTLDMQSSVTEVNSAISSEYILPGVSDSGQSIGITASTELEENIEKRTEKLTTLMESSQRFDSKAAVDYVTPSADFSIYTAANAMDVSNDRGHFETTNERYLDSTPSHVSLADSTTREQSNTDISIKTTNIHKDSSVVNFRNSMENEKHTDAITTTTNFRTPGATSPAPVHDQLPGNRGTISCPQLGLITLIYLILLSIKWVLV
ncbi:uncharacterized protein LOC106156077 [Lingula anatina]|uniref:Uncharacterized protein LOC106156077 n=1 Tax=Lingula anatina TaxID=7574 RepID=A0A1S3HKM3_LINAN|nr:uncharacterized protein LOC106156077 [Lingula anatina]|eukprot:XP_013386648.2 uncharacterized protein LOC106156077 [Lingula anatina]